MRKVQLIRWIDMNAARLPVTQLYDRYANPPLGETVTGVPFPFSLHRGSLAGPHFPPNIPLCGRFQIQYTAPGNLEPARIERLKKSCNDKCPKLAIWKRDAAARTVLVLEENDLSLTTHQRVSDALSLAEATIPETTDEVFLVSTQIANMWWVTCLRMAEKPYYDDGDRFQQVDPRKLMQLTSR
jgi:hypothetical protein